MDKKLITQHIWLILIILPLALFLPLYPGQRTKDFVSYRKDWNSSFNPIWFLHASDTHLSSVWPESKPHIFSSLNKSINIFKPKRIMLTGDLVRNYIQHPVRPYHQQNKEDWELLKLMYKELNFTNDKVISVVGNHDLFLIPDFDYPNNYGKDFLYDKDTFHMNVSFFTQDNFKVKFISINVFDFPIGPICFYQSMYISNEFEQLLKTELSKSNSDYTIIVSHIPIFRFVDHQRLIKILSISKNLRFFISGHLHPANGYFMHFGDTFEAVGPPLFKSSNIGIVTIDNFHSAYHIINLDNPPLAILTNPVPTNQTSSYDSFSQNNTEVRALLFSDDINVNLSIKGSINGQLKCAKKLEEGIYLCSLPINLDAGEYSFEMIGDWKGYINFTVGNKIKGFIEHRYDTFEKQTIIITCFVINLIIIIMIFLPAKPSTDCKRKFALLSSFDMLRTSIYSLPKCFYYLLLASFVWSLFLPHVFFTNENLIGFMSLLGFTQGTKFKFHYMGFIYALYFFYFHLYPIFVVVNAVVFSKKKRKILLFDLFLFVSSFLGVWYEFIWLINMFGVIPSLISPSFSILPIVMYVMLAFWVYKQKEELKILMKWRHYCFLFKII